MRALLIAAAMLSSMPALAQEPGSRQTREFVQAASESDAFEIAEAQSALAQSTDASVLAFARQMIRDHMATSQALAAAAATAGLTSPVMAIGEGQSPFLAALQSARGQAFDDLYWRQQALAHRAALVTEQRYAASGDTPAVRQAAIAAVPVIQAHLEMADRMASSSR